MKVHPMTTKNTLMHYLQRLLVMQFHGRQAGLAETLDVDKTHVSRLMRGQTTTMGTDSCLRLAHACDVNPDEVLELAGKGETARIIRRLYGKAAPVRHELTEDERAWLRAFRDMTADHQRSMIDLARALTATTGDSKYG